MSAPVRKCGHSKVVFGCSECKLDAVEMCIDAQGALEDMLRSVEALSLAAIDFAAHAGFSGDLQTALTDLCREAREVRNGVRRTPLQS